MWESPIKTICDEMRTQFEGEVLKAVQRVGIEVDKDQLIKALNYDRNQYDEGYKHGYSYAKSELIRCKDCKYSSHEPCEGFENVYVCDRSVFTRCVGGNMPYDFCSYAERRTDD